MNLGRSLFSSPRDILSIYIYLIRALKPCQWLTVTPAVQILHAEVRREGGDGAEWSVPQ